MPLLFFTKLDCFCLRPFYRFCPLSLGYLTLFTRAVGSKHVMRQLNIGRYAAPILSGYNELSAGPSAVTFLQKTLSNVCFIPHDVLFQTSTSLCNRREAVGCFRMYFTPFYGATLKVQLSNSPYHSSGPQVFSFTWGINQPIPRRSLENSARKEGIISLRHLYSVISSGEENTLTSSMYFNRGVHTEDDYGTYFNRGVYS